jgi:hypothetical protein
VALEFSASHKSRKEDLKMHISKLLVVNSLLALAFTLAALMAVPACTVNVKKGENNADKKVDIETPMGGIHVSKDADVRDTGLLVYPGARPRHKEENGEERNANVNISGMGYGLKVVAVDFESDDPPEKVIAYYQDQLKKYGNVIQCHSSGHGTTYDRESGKGSGALKCEGNNTGKTIELKAGTEDRQHIVSIEPQSSGKGSNFALVYVQTHGKDETI